MLRYAFVEGVTTGDWSKVTCAWGARNFRDDSDGCNIPIFQQFSIGEEELDSFDYILANNRPCWFIELVVEAIQTQGFVIINAPEGILNFISAKIEVQEVSILISDDRANLNNLHFQPGSIIHAFAKQLRVVGNKGVVYEVRISDSPCIINEHIYSVFGSPLYTIMEHTWVLITIFELIDLCLLLKEGSIVITDTLQLIGQEDFFVCKILIRRIVV